VDEDRAVAYVKEMDERPARNGPMPKLRKASKQSADEGTSVDEVTDEPTDEDPFLAGNDGREIHLDDVVPAKVDDDPAEGDHRPVGRRGKKPVPTG
jgi:hypothetical protein